jgi:hypothetical protein
MTSLSHRRITTTTSAGVAGIKIIAAPSKQTEVFGLYTVIWNDLLSFLNCYKHMLNTDILRQAALDFFKPDEIAEGKMLLLGEFEVFLGDVGQFKAKRRTTQERPAHEAEFDDILGLFKLVVSKPVGLTEKYLFVVSDFARLSSLIVDESGPDGVDTRQVNTKLEESVEKMSASIETLVSSCQQRGDMSAMEQSLQSAVRDMDSRLAAFNTMITDRLDYLHSVCNQLNDTVASSHVGAPSRVQASPAMPSQHQLDRSMNIVVFGVAEDRSHLVWRQQVDQALKFITGKDIESTDMFRLGRFVANKTRPIIVKLRTAWDRRILLANCNRLKGYGDGKIYISPDESLEERRKRMLKRLKFRAERDGNDVSVENGILSVGGVPVFSLQDGKIAST